MSKVLIFSCVLWLYILVGVVICVFAYPSDVKVCFTPGERCDKEIVSEIDHENKRVWVQAYYLTSRDIINAIINAKKRGADVRVIIDREGIKDILTIPFRSYSIPIWVDRNVVIAHNKVIILGYNEVITGSYNFTKSAQKKNAENMLIIKSDKVAWEYADNFIHRMLVSQKIY